MKTDELREKYLSFFQSKGCTRRPSDVLVPKGDPSVLFTPAGMNPFKDHFLGKVKLDFTRATSCQKCLRTGDIENVGRTAYHHTFFEMLGNFSFGDYFKRDAIHWAWEFLTERKWLGLSPARLSVSVYLDDDEAASIWADEIGLPSSKVVRMGEDDNFWPAGAPSGGPDGVCGPCSEVFYHPESGGPGSEVEIWNLVFTQFNRVGDPPDNLRPLPSKNIDTGMGLERTASVLQRVDTNYHIDTLRPIVEAAAEVCGTAYEPGSEAGRRLRRITDHVRACCVAIHENVYPGPNKQNYVIRRLLRRAVLDGHQMGRHEPFLHQLVPVVVEMLRQPYPEHVDTADRVADVIHKEEGSFFATIDAGLERIDRVLGELQGKGRVVFHGQDAFDLYQTYGVPPELVESIAAEHNLSFDWDGFRESMEEHGKTSGAKQVELFKTGPIEALKRAVHGSEFVGYDTIEAAGEIVGIIAQDNLCDEVEEIGHDAPIVVVLDRTPFYGESGGQVGDTGEITGEGFRFNVTDTQKDGELILHYGHLVEGKMSAGARVTARVDERRRDAIRRAHSATHVLHYALQKHVGKHATQRGSKVDADWLRFDFTNDRSVDAQQLEAIAADVNEQIAAGAEVQWKYVPLAEARTAGAMMLFGEKYPDPVRMVSMGTFSKELCGGTHLANTAEVEQFEIISEESVSAGTRRIVALTGAKAREHHQQAEAALRQAAELLGVAAVKVPDAAARTARELRDLKKSRTGGGKPAARNPDGKADTAALAPAEIKHTLQQAAKALNVAPLDVPERIAAMLAEIQSLRAELAAGPDLSELSAGKLLAGAHEVGGAKIVVAEAPGANANLMRQLIDQLRKTASPIAVLLAAAQGSDKVLLVAGVSHELVERGASAGDWVREVAKLVDGSGGGKPDMAQAGGKDPSKLPEALQQAEAFIRQKLGK